MRVFTCSGCSVRIKVPDERVGRFACPKCGKGLLIKAPSAGGSASPTTTQPRAAPIQNESFAGLPAIGEFPARPVVPSRSGVYAPHTGQPRSKAATKDTAALKSFLKRLGIGLGILAGVLVLLTGLGMIAEPIALAAAIVGGLSALGLIVSGKIWLWVIAFQESVVQGLLVLLVPYYWIVYLATRKGRALQPFALIVSALVPAVLSLGMVALFAVRYDNVARSVSGRGSGSRTLQFSQSKLRDAEARIRQSYETTPEANVLRTVSFQTFTQVRGPIDPVTAERVLADLPGYVAGSFRVDEVRRIVMFQYHGDKDTAKWYAFFLPANADIMLSMTPTFIDQTDLPEANVIATPKRREPTVAAVSPSQATIPVPVTTELNELRTVSFQTLAQSTIDSSRAEQVLAESSGYVPGSFRFDPDQQLVTFQYRGPQAMATQYAFTLQGRLFITMRLKPIFADETSPGQP